MILIPFPLILTTLRLSFIVGGRCDKLNAAMAANAKIDTLLGGDDTCFDVIARLDSGCWYLFAASIISIAVGQLVMRTCHKALRERTAEQNRRESVSFDSAEASRVTGEWRVRA